MPDASLLSRRERQIMEIIYARGRASANDVMADLPDPPTRTSIRTVMRILEHKGHLSHKLEGREFVYRPTAPHSQAGKSALKSVIRAFFGDSPAKALAAHLADPKTKLSPVEARELRELINQARKRGD
jgi:predicted transcriptional regulator